MSNNIEDMKKKFVPNYSPISKNTLALDFDEVDSTEYGVLVRVLSTSYAEIEELESMGATLVEETPFSETDGGEIITNLFYDTPLTPWYILNKRPLTKLTCDRDNCEIYLGEFYDKEIALEEARWIAQALSESYNNEVNVFTHYDLGHQAEEIKRLSAYPSSRY